MLFHCITDDVLCLTDSSKIVFLYPACMTFENEYFFLAKVILC